MMKALFYFIMIMMFIGCNDSEKPPTQVPVTETKDYKKDAIYNARGCLRQMLKAPNAAKFPVSDDAMVTQLDDTTYHVQEYVDAQNEFGVMLRSLYSCTVKFMPDGKNECSNIKMD